jgi:hypothetical protein
MHSLWRNKIFGRRRLREVHGHFPLQAILIICLSLIIDGGFLGCHHLLACKHKCRSVLVFFSYDDDGLVTVGLGLETLLSCLLFFVSFSCIFLPYGRMMHKKDIHLTK